MNTPKFPLGTRVEFNDDPLTLAFIASIEKVTSRSREEFLGVFTVRGLRDPATDPELMGWDVCITDIPDKKVWVCESFLRLAKESIN